MYTEFKVYQLNFKPSCPSNPHPLSNKRKYIMVSQLYYIAALSLMRKSYKPNEWPKTVIHDHVPVQLHISLPQHHWVVALQLWEPQGPEQRQLLLSRQEQREELRLRGMGAAHLSLGQDLYLRKQTKASDSKASRLILLSCASRLDSVTKPRESWWGMCHHFRE